MTNDRRIAEDTCSSIERDIVAALEGDWTVERRLFHGPGMTLRLASKDGKIKAQVTIGYDWRTVSATPAGGAIALQEEALRAKRRGESGKGPSPSGESPPA